jgi:hypothetical protein
MLTFTYTLNYTECIQGSYHIPFYCRRIKSLKGIEVVDGAYGFAGTHSQNHYHPTIIHCLPSQEHKI